jgi:hypothetical protein
MMFDLLTDQGLEKAWPLFDDDHVDAGRPLLRTTADEPFIYCPGHRLPRSDDVR